jgi:hypothetical protein
VLLGLSVLLTVKIACPPQGACPLFLGSREPKAQNPPVVSQALSGCWRCTCWSGLVSEQIHWSSGPPRLGGV